LNLRMRIDYLSVNKKNAKFRIGSTDG
jgi:hypothetical protein